MSIELWLTTVFYLMVGFFILRLLLLGQRDMVKWARWAVLLLWPLLLLVLALFLFLKTMFEDEVLP